MTERPAPARRVGGRQRIPRPSAHRFADSTGWPDRDAPTAAEIAQAVAAAALDDALTAPTFQDARPSAVLVALVDGAKGAEVLLTKRAKELRNHSGEISFPGGRLDPGETPVDAALREAYEEVGLQPGAAHVHGRLSQLSTIVSRSHIVPVVATLDERPTLVASVREVERILWVPIAELVQPSTHREEWWGTPPLDRRMNFFDLDDETIWGATAFILYELLGIVYGPPNSRTAL